MRLPCVNLAAGRAPGRPQAGPHPVGGSADVLVGRGAVISATLLDEATARSEICRVGRSLFDRGYVHATAGNISVRLADGFLITPTDACLGSLDPDRLARLDADGRQVAGDRASKTIALHRRIYAAARPEPSLQAFQEHLRHDAGPVHHRPTQCHRRDRGRDRPHRDPTRTAPRWSRARLRPSATEPVGWRSAELLAAHPPFAWARAVDQRLAELARRYPTAKIEYVNLPGKTDAPVSVRLLASGSNESGWADFVMKVGRVPHIPYRSPGADEAAEAVAQAIARHAADGRHLRAVMLARLGPTSGTTRRPPR